MKLVYPIILYPMEEHEGGYTVEVPDLPGCVTEGHDLADALDMARDAASGWILDEMEDGRAVPHASNITDVKPDEPDGIVSLISLDMDAYAEKYGSKAVRKNVTIPAWLDTFGERNNINYSQVLREGLESRYRALQDALLPYAESPGAHTCERRGFRLFALCGLLDDFGFDDVGVVVEVGDGLVEQGGE